MAAQETKSAPASVATYLRDHAPRGHLIGYWLDRRHDFNVLTLHRRGEELCFSISSFPEVVGHWGHQLTGGNFSPAALRLHVRDGLWGADEPTKARVAALLDRIENGLSFDEVLASCRAACDPLGRFDPRSSAEPVRAGPVTNEAQFRKVSALVATLAGENPVHATAAAEALTAMGITENEGPLFARDALLKFRRRAR